MFKNKKWFKLFRAIVVFILIFTLVTQFVIGGFRGTCNVFFWIFWINSAVPTKMPSITSLFSAAVFDHVYHLHLASIAVFVIFNYLILVVVFDN